MYARRLGVPQDYSQAIILYRKAAERGYAKAQNNLGFMYCKGQGVPQDYSQAHMWFNLAASQRNKNAAGNRELAARSMTPADISKAQRLAREWAAKHRKK